MRDERACSRPGCPRNAAATLTYDYPDSMVVIGPLSPRREPNGYDLCVEHAERMSLPKGWQVVRHSVFSELGT